MADDHEWLRRAVELSRKCSPRSTAFNVGAIVVDTEGHELVRGYSRETDDTSHAEESAMSKVDPNESRLGGATMYSSLEPCSTRTSRDSSCTDLILDAGITKVVFALREPPVFVRCEGVERLRAGGVTVVQLPEFTAQVREINAHLLGA